jgi:hypothetical protein
VAIDTTVVDKLMGIYKQKLISLVPKASATIAIFQKVANMKTEGGKIYVPIQTATAHTVGPKALFGVDSPAFDEATHPFGHAYGTIEFETEMFERMKTDSNFAIKGLQPWLAQVEDMLKRYLSTSMWSKTGGRLAKVSAVDGGKTGITILPIVANATLYPYDATKLFIKGLYVEFRTSGGTDHGVSKITNVNRATGVLTLSAANNSVAADDYVYWKDCYLKPPSAGIPDMIDDTGLYGTINRATVTDFASYIQRATLGQPLTTDLIDNMFFESSKEDGDEADEDGDIDLVITTKKVIQAYRKLFTYVVNVPPDGSGIKGINASIGKAYYNAPNGKTVEFKVIKMCPEGTAWGLRTKKLFQFYARPWQWLEYGMGAGLEKYFEWMGRINGEADVYRGMGSQLYNYFTNNPAFHAAILDIDVTAGES